jgi:YD repeat-containing protein
VTGYGYSAENRLLGMWNGLSLSYDPLGRMVQTGNANGITRYGYDGPDLIAEYSNTTAIARRHVHGPGIDEPLVQYEGSGTSDRRFLHAEPVLAKAGKRGFLSGRFRCPTARPL